MGQITTILAVAALAALASPTGGLIALWRQPTSMFLSIALGFASGVLLGSIAFEMLPQALELASLTTTVAGFVAGFAAIYVFDLFIHRWRLAGHRSEEHPRILRFYARHRPRGGEVTVLAGGTSAEELIEGLSIGVGTAIRPGVGLLIALAILIDNVSEALSIGELIRSEKGSAKQTPTGRILGWTSLIGAALFSAAVVGWYFLRDLPEPVLGFLFAAGAGGMFYLTVTDLIPEAADRHYQQSSAICMSAGFLIIFVLQKFL